MIHLKAEEEGEFLFSKKKLELFPNKYKNLDENSSHHVVAYAPVTLSKKVTRGGHQA